ncbi:MAG: alpha-glucan family phosphorylase [Actinomycetota bacterium]|nr:alpha-glucan family phosphorylase [Actinomycetota bacterium]
MQALRTFTVRYKLPEPLAPLEEMATNLRWSWDRRTRALFRRVDPEAWVASQGDPRALFALTSLGRLEALARDPDFLAELTEVQDQLRRYCDQPRWFQQRPGSRVRSIAYFSPEFGLTEALPQYSGGLGALAGDHLKAASDLGLPLTGVGLLYRQGYFRQSLDSEGWQVERYPTLDPHAMALRRVEESRVQVDLAGRTLTAHVWRVDVGRVRLLMLDSDVEENDPEMRLITDRLYGGGGEHRLRQEILLGIGGVRALDAVGEEGQIFHTNEGHAGFLGLERIRRLMTEEAMTLAEAVEAVRAGTIFTTHTPVPAGIDRFPRELMERYFTSLAAECGVAFDDLMALGHLPGEPVDAPFNMAVMGLRLAGASNGVSKLHGEVSRAMYSPLWPELDVEEVPITSVTNGVHAPSWVAPEMDDLLSAHVSPVWPDADASAWAGLKQATAEELMGVRDQGRGRMVADIRRRLRVAELARGVTPSDAAWTDDVLDPAVLTIGFARRFASYKRATLLLSQPERLESLLLSAERPVQLVFAGKAHPADDLGKEMIREVVQFSRRPQVRHRIVFVDDYDIAVARSLYQGCDVWLNNPRRPLEACGTSGEKAALNGALNCSILDGWWAEMFDGENGWAVSSAEGTEDLGRRDESEANSLYDVLERQVAPLFYDRRDGTHPWADRVRTSLMSLGPRVVAGRMVHDYLDLLYEPMARREVAMTASGYDLARELSQWKQRVRAAWPQVAVNLVDVDPGPADLGAERNVEVLVNLGSLTPDDVVVELVHGPLGPDGTMASSVVVMEPKPVSTGDQPGTRRYAGRFVCERAGHYGYAARMVPTHPGLIHRAETGLVAWA